MSGSKTSPLLAWHYPGTLRTYQAQVLERIPAGSGPALHIVAPPGAGKTLLGLLLAMREGHRALVLAPNTTIREQWARTARTLAPDPGTVSEDPQRIGDLTALTYQSLSVTGDGAPFESLALARWTDELVEAGRGEADAATWLAELGVGNPARYRSGLARRVKGLRRRFTRERPDAIARVLHPNAVALMQRIVDAGVDTIVLDECHHLLDHWALVVAYLVGRIRERGGSALVIGLTATLPDVADGAEYDNYTQLLGEVDFEVPTPAVVKEGHLAPYRDHVWFTEPVPAEAAFIRRHGAQLLELLAQVLSTPDGIRYLEDQLQPAEPTTASRAADPDGPAPGRGPGTAPGPGPGPGGATRSEAGAGPSTTALERALADDLALTRSCGVVLRHLAPAHPIVAILPPVLFDRCTTDDLLTVLARFALTWLLPDPAAAAQWAFVKRALADFGLLLTDRGIRRGRDPVETTLAFSEAKDRAVLDILRAELAGADGDRVKAVVVTDFVQHGNSRGLTGESTAGALRVYDQVVNDPEITALTPVLLTADRIRVPTVAAVRIAAAIAARTGSPVSVVDGVGPFRDLDAAGAGLGRIVAAVSDLVADGLIRLLVGTRGLLGEGWDCPAVNTLIDLTTVTTSTGAPQLRGRTLRLDPAWPGKVAHNWSVACLIPADVPLDDVAEPNRLRRRHAHLLGLSADDDGRIVRGLGNALPLDARHTLGRVLAKDPASSLAVLQAITCAGVRPRAETRAAWRIGERYADVERETLVTRTVSVSALIPTERVLGGALPWAFLLGTAVSGLATVTVSAVAPLSPTAGAVIALAGGAALTLAGTIGPLGRTRRRRRDPSRTLHGAAIAVVRALAQAGRIRPVDESTIVVRPNADGRTRIEIGGPDQRLIADALEELFAPPANPRFLLRTDRADVPRSFSVVGAVVGLQQRGTRRATFLPVPRAIARRRADAEAFARIWHDTVGEADLVALQGEQGLALLALARRSPRVLDAAEPRTSIWG